MVVHYIRKQKSAGLYQWWMHLKLNLVGGKHGLHGNSRRLEHVMAVICMLHVSSMSTANIKVAWEPAPVAELMRLQSDIAAAVYHQCGRTYVG
jgi:hypothetical protein